MASLRFLVVFLALSSPICFGAADAAAPSKVTLSFYYFALCTNCETMIVNYLPGIFENGLISIVDLDLVPFVLTEGVSSNDTSISMSQIRRSGIIRRGRKFRFGELFGKNRQVFEKDSEARFRRIMTTVEACAINTLPDVREHFKFVWCVEKMIFERKYTDWESCYQTTGVDSQAIENCYKGEYGIQLEKEYVTRIFTLQPPLKYLPWVVVDGKPLYDNYRNFEAHICKAYNGEPPKACEGLLSPKEMKEKREKWAAIERKDMFFSH